MARSPTYRTWGRRRGNRWPSGSYLPGYPVHVVIAAYGNRPVFKEPGLAADVVRQLAAEPQTLAACLMPDHLHWLLGDGARMIPVVQRLKSVTTRDARQRGHLGKLWQRSYWDHVVRRTDSLVEVARYILANPVRAGLVTEAEAYPFQILRLGGTEVGGPSV